METSLSLLAGASGPENVLIFSNISPPYCVPAVGCLYPGTLPGSPGTLTLSPWQELFLLSFAGQILNMAQLYLSDTFYTSFTVRKQACITSRIRKSPFFLLSVCININVPKHVCFRKLTNFYRYRQASQRDFYSLDLKFSVRIFLIKMLQHWGSEDHQVPLRCLKVSSCTFYWHQIWLQTWAVWKPLLNKLTETSSNISYYRRDKVEGL